MCFFKLICQFNCIQKIMLGYYTCRHFSWFLSVPYFTEQLNFVYNTPRWSSNRAGSPGWIGRKSWARTWSPTLKITLQSNFSGLLDVALGSMVWLIVWTVLPIITSAGDFLLSLGWTLVLHLIRDSLINIFFSHSRFCFVEGTFQCIYEISGLAIRLQL